MQWIILMLWLGVWFLVQTFEGEILTQKDAAQDIRAIRKLLGEIAQDEGYSSEENDP